MNLYAYCGNDPVNKYDPSGHFAIISFLISVGVGAAISIAMEAIEDGKDGQFFNDKDFWDYFGAGVGGAISGMAGNATAAILLGGVASMLETAISGEATTYNMMSSFLTGAIGFLCLTFWRCLLLLSWDDYSWLAQMIREQQDGSGG